MARQESNQNFLITSFLDGTNALYIEQLHARYEDDPASVAPEWQDFFKALADNPQDVKKAAQGPSWQRSNWPPQADGELIAALDGNWRETVKDVAREAGAKAKAKVEAAAAASGAPVDKAVLEQAVRDASGARALMQAYRTHGHLRAKLDPIGLSKPQEDYDLLSPATYGFTEADYDREIFTDNAFGRERATLREFLGLLQETYSGSIGFEYAHIFDPQQREWLQARIEGQDRKAAFGPEAKKTILQKLVEAQGFEQFLDVKYKGTKRFGLDGGEAAIPGIEQAIAKSAELGVREVVIGMAHRGRLNVLTNVTHKPARAIFHEFKGGSFKPDDVAGSGDVKYHLGASVDRDFGGHKVHLSLTPNPSHLEVVNPVVLGKSRAKQDQIAEARDENGAVPVSERSKVLPLLIHGDAAFPGQGVVAETLGLWALPGYTVAGSLHVIINNQVGFTTNPWLSRSSRYSSDLAKSIEAPIFHVNGDDPEAVTFVMELAAEFRLTFHKPAVVDLICYRRFGHNEGDEPSFTQPKMYKVIRAHERVLEIYAARLVGEGVVSNDEVEQRRAAWRSHLEAEFEGSDSFKPNKADWLDGRWTGIRTPDREDVAHRGVTGIPLDRLKEIGQKLTTIPESVHVHPTIQRFINDRAQAIETGENINWATGEALAFGSLLLEGFPVRLSGEDCERGTFSQRHSVLNDQETEDRYTPLNNLASGQARYEVINSMLSEEAVLGYEYGYSITEPNALTLWEGQFGDFANGAQVMFDQFISSGEAKWLRMSGLVMLLPHGYEGQGPEHSSGRVERYLQLCAEDNIQVANCTTPANYFHILRRQLKRDFRKPLVLMTPKSLLRHKRAVSRLAELAENTTFHRILWDDAEVIEGGLIKLQKDAKIRRVVLCTGKVYYDLLEEREKRGIDDIYLLRVEQLYPFPSDVVAKELARFPNAEIVWCQEEPKNMGAWFFVAPYIEDVLISIGAKHNRPRYTGRPAAPSPAVGTMREHLAQIQAFLEEALGG